MVLFQRLFDLFGFKHGAPVALEQRDVRAAALEDFRQQVAEAAERRDQHLVAGADRRGQHGLEAAARRRIDDVRLVVLRLENLARHLHRLVHQLREFRVKLADDVGAHCAQHARVCLDRAGRHQHARGGIDLFKCHFERLPFLFSLSKITEKPQGCAIPAAFKHSVGRHSPPYCKYSKNVQAPQGAICLSESALCRQAALFRAPSGNKRARLLGTFSESRACRFVRGSH